MIEKVHSLKKMVNNLEKEGCSGTKDSESEAEKQHLMAIRKAMAEEGRVLSKKEVDGQSLDHIVWGKMGRVDVMNENSANVRITVSSIYAA